MALYEFEGRRPSVGKESYVSETADVIGDVIIGNNCYIGPGARIKGDYGSIRIGNESNVQENCVIHARPGEQCIIGNGCSIGHGAVLHNCTIRDGAKVGMAGVVSDYAVVGEDSIIGEGCVVKQYQVILSQSIAVGVPAKVIGIINAERIAERDKYRYVYPDLAKRYLAGLKRVE